MANIIQTTERVQIKPRGSLHKKKSDCSGDDFLNFLKERVRQCATNMEHVLYDYLVSFGFGV
jgi:hypothetical protein